MAMLKLFPEPQKWQFLRMRITNLAKNTAHWHGSAEKKPWISRPVRYVSRN